MANWQWKSSVILVSVFLFLFDSAILKGTRSAIAQVIPDDTLGNESSVVNSRDGNSDLIDGGAVRGQNLFHSFQEFNVNQGRGVYFANPETITNIFSRVTGSNASNILGTLGVDGAANLFLINPKGIIFGEDASLDLAGSFAATTADGIEFGAEGSFNALNPQIPQLLTIDPSAFFYNQLNEGIITNNSASLSVPDGKSLIFLGGNVAIARGSLNTVGGSIELGGLAESGRVVIELDNDILNLSFPGGIAKGNVNLDNSSLVTEGGNIEIIATNISLDNTELITTANIGDAGDIQFIADNVVDLFDSEIISRMEQGNGGDAGNISIQGNSLLAIDTTFRSDSQAANGDGGDVTFAIADSTIINRGFGIISDINQGSAGEAGDIQINSGSLSVLGTAISSETNTGGTAGNIVIQVDDTISFVAAEISSSNLSGTLAGGIAGNTTINAGSLFLSDETEIKASNNGRDLGNSVGAGNINIAAKDTIFLSNSEISSIALESDSQGNDNSGTINLQSSSLVLTDRAQISVSTDSQGDAGDIFIEAKDFVSVDRGSAISSAVQEDIAATGNGGSIQIDTRSLFLTNGGQLNASVLGEIEAESNIIQGDGGNIIVNASESVNLSGFNPLELESFSRDSSPLPGASTGFYTIAEVGSTGSSGNIEVNTKDLTIADGAVITAQTFNDNDGGNITIKANSLTTINGGQILSNTSAAGNAGRITLNLVDDVAIAGSDLNFSERLELFEPEAIVNAGAASGIFANTDVDSIGNGGEILLTGNSFSLENAALISAQSEGTGNAGNLDLRLQNEVSIVDSKIVTAAASAAGGRINLSGKNISLANNADISTNVTSGIGGGGDINFTADSIIAFDDSDIFAFASDEGIGGNINLDTPAFFAEGFTLNSLTSNPESLNNNDRVDVNATGAVSGVVSIPDVSFIQNSLNDLPDNSINTNELVANSCVAPVGSRQQGRFIITGGDSLPVRPGNADIVDFSTGSVRNVPQNHTWQRGEPIIEPQGVYRLTNGELILSRECSSSDESKF